jgi:putative ATPase
MPATSILDSHGLAELVSGRAPAFDRAGDQHYNLMSALHKTLRSSDADAGLYWLARMLAGGEDPHYILRRLTRFAIEDILQNLRHNRAPWPHGMPMTGLAALKAILPLPD